MAGEASGNAQDTPQFQDALSQLWGRIQDPNQAPVAPVPTMQPGYPGGVGVRSVQTPVPPVKAPSPSDDPSIAMPTLPAAPTFQSPDLLKQRLAARAQIDAITAAHANDAANNKPHWYDRLLGGATGALVGGITGNAKQGAEVGGRVTNRAFNRVDAERQKELTPFFNQLNAEKEDQPFYTNADTDTERSFRGQFDVAKEKREQESAIGREKTAQDRADAYGAKFVAGSEVQDDKSPTGWTAETASGERKPFTPKSATAAPKEPKNADEALSAASSALAKGDHKEYDRLTQLAKDLHKQEVDRVREARPPKEDKNLRGTPNQFRGAEDKKTAALRAAEDDFDKATKDIDLKRQHGTGKTDEDAKMDESSYQDDRSRYAEQVRILEQKKAAAQDAYEADIRTLGGETASSPGQTPPTQAAPAAPGIAKPPQPGASLTDRAVTEKYFRAAGWDGKRDANGKIPNAQQYKAKAQELAKQDGWKF